MAASGQDDRSQMLVCGGCCCFMYSLFFKFPECIGISEAGTCLCIDTRASCRCVVPTTCCLRQEQCLCLDARCAIPPNHEAPCVMGALGVVCYANPNKEEGGTKLGVCMTVKDLLGKTSAAAPTIVVQPQVNVNVANNIQNNNNNAVNIGNVGGGGGAPEEEEMQK